MADQKVPATLAELKVTFLKSTADWRESQLEAGASLSESAVSYAKHIEAKAEEAEKVHAQSLETAKVEAKANAAKEAEEAAGKRAAAGGALGHKPVTARGARGGNLADKDEYVESGDAVEDFNAAVRVVAGSNPGLDKRQRAVRFVASKNPDLYQAYLLSTNPGKRQSRLIAEKLESVGIRR